LDAQIEGQTVSEVQDSKTVNQLIQEFIKKHDIKTQKHITRPWGGFSTSFSMDGNTWVAAEEEHAKFFGWGFELEYGVAEYIREIVTNHLDQSVIDYIGEERVNELKQIISCSQPSEPLTTSSESSTTSQK
jgi:hypothetical protein